jgi:chloramphenicol O-acetyltransferase
MNYPLSFLVAQHCAALAATGVLTACFRTWRSTIRCELTLPSCQLPASLVFFFLLLFFLLFPSFHFFLYHVVTNLWSIENFRYRISHGEVIMIDKLIPSYTVMNKDNLVNFTRIEYSTDFKVFLKGSLEASEKSSQSQSLSNSGIALDEKELKCFLFMTCLPWLKFTSIEHPIWEFKAADIPSIAWGKYCLDKPGKLTMPFAIQVHHGFVDGYHIHLLGEKIKMSIEQMIK